jgi:hypothetical protein
MLDIAPTPPPAARVVGTLVVHSPVAASGVLDGDRRFTVPANGTYSFTDLAPGRHSVSLTSGEKTWESSTWVTAGKKAELIAEFASTVATPATPATSSDATKRVRPKAH